MQQQRYGCSLGIYSHAENFHCVAEDHKTGGRYIAKFTSFNFIGYFSQRRNGIAKIAFLKSYDFQHFSAQTLLIATRQPGEAPQLSADQGQTHKGKHALCPSPQVSARK